MPTPYSPPLTDSELHALVDGQLCASERAALERRLVQDPAAQITLARWMAQRSQLKGLQAHVLQEPVPPTLLAAARQFETIHRRGHRFWQLGGRAAVVLLAFGAGWLGHSTWHVQGGQSMAGTTPPAAEFVRQARFAHAVYAPEVRHPVEVAATERDHLVQWLSRRLGRPLKVPDLAAEGYTLVGGRLLPGDAGARAQFMFQNAAGTRVTLYLGAVTAPTGGAAKTTGANTHETAFRFATDAGLPSFYWVDQGFGYALSGPLDRTALLGLANEVYHQL
jgi:anti-sigma factor RsiW